MEQKNRKYDTKNCGRFWPAQSSAFFLISHARVSKDFGASEHSCSMSFKLGSCECARMLVRTWLSWLLPKAKSVLESGCHMAFWILNLHLSLDDAEIEPSLMLRLKLRILNFRETSQKDIQDAIAFCSPIPGTVQPPFYLSLWVSVRECECVGGKSLGVSFQNDGLIFTSVHNLRVLPPHRYWLVKHCDINLEFHLSEGLGAPPVEIY